MARQAGSSSTNRALVENEQELTIANRSRVSCAHSSLRRGHL